MSSPPIKPSILLQLDTDPQPSVFDGVVAVDSGVDHLFRHGGVTPENVRDLVFGTLFTRSSADIHRTAIFIGGSNVSAGEAVLEAVKKTFFASFRVSVLLDANGANTTAAAAVLAAFEGSEGSLQGVSTAVLAATGPVGQRVARLLGRLGANVALGSRSLDRATVTADTLKSATNAIYTPFSTAIPEDLLAGLVNASVVIAAGTAGALLLPLSIRDQLPRLKVAIDLNAVPPLGIEGVKSSDKNTERNGHQVWGALGVGGVKMKIHKKALQEIFKSSDKILDAEEVFALGQSIT